MTVARRVVLEARNSHAFDWYFQIETCSSIMDLSDSISRSTASVTSGFARSFFVRSIIGRDAKDTLKEKQGGSKGPVGLTTLYEPEGHASADLIFVHGLNGGSQSTWSKGSGLSFWPRDWLPCDDAFRDVRIHSFGYSSGLNRESILNYP